MQNLKSLIFILIVHMLPFACTENKGDPNDPQAAYLAAKEAYDDENFEIAVSKLKEFKARFPYSNLATKAELEIADSHFRLEQYPEASAVYSEFIKLHPKHTEVDFAKFRIGLCNWNLAPESIDRDQEYTEKALVDFRELLKDFPQSKYSSEAQSNLDKGERRIAEALNFTGAFYCKQEIWHACAQSSMELIENWGKFKDLAKVASKRVAVSFENLAILKDREPESDKNLFFKSMSSAEMRKKSALFAASSDKM